jgi:hypothetical protein
MLSPFDDLVVCALRLCAIGQPFVGFEMIAFVACRSRPTRRAARPLRRMLRRRRFAVGVKEILAHLATAPVGRAR